MWDAELDLGGGVVLNLDGGRRIWLCTPPTDMRHSFDGQFAMARNDLGADPTSGH